MPTRGQHDYPQRPTRGQYDYPQRPPSRLAARHGTDNEQRSREPDPPQPPRRTRRLDASPWHWLLLVPIVLPLMPSLYNRIDPTFLGLPFFYWCQLGFAFLASIVIAIVHLKVR
jgi:uncharacterized protein DUF3311